MTEETDEGARLREALSQCSVFQEDELKPAPAPDDAAAPKQDANATAPAPKGPQRGDAIRAALDKMFLATGEGAPPAAKAAQAAAPKEEVAAPPPAQKLANVKPVAPAAPSKADGGRALMAVLDRACFASLDTLHFDPDDGELAVWCRVQGRRVDLGRVPVAEVEAKMRDGGSSKAAVKIAKVLAGPGLQTIELAALPGPRGTRYVARGFADIVVEGLEELGLDPEVNEELAAELARVKGGAFVLGAPPRHGVKTTLRAIARECAKHRKLVASLVPSGEAAPVDGVVDVFSANPGVPWEAAFSEAMRHDPDVLVAGRLADARQATAVFGAALAGVRVFCALSAPNANAAHQVLRAIGLDEWTVRQSRTVFTTQCLVNGLCLLCREPDDAGVAELRSLGFPDSDLRAATIYRAVGCDRCVSGYRGKFAVMENLSYPTPEGGQGAPPSSQTNSPRRVSLVESVFRAVARGRTTVAELTRSIQELSLSHGKV